MAFVLRQIGRDQQRCHEPGQRDEQDRERDYGLDQGGSALPCVFYWFSAWYLAGISTIRFEVPQMLGLWDTDVYERTLDIECSEW